jgi:hypothetical protein
MMKKGIFGALLIGTIVLFSCDNESVLVLQDVFVSNSISGLSGDGEPASFLVGDIAYFRFTVIDEDLDAEKILITQQYGLLIIGPIAMYLEQQNEAIQHYTGTMRIEYPGEWEISAYCLDKKGNRSDTVTIYITVTEE